MRFAKDNGKWTLDHVFAPYRVTPVSRQLVLQCQRRLATQHVQYRRVTKPVPSSHRLSYRGVTKDVPVEVL